MKRQSLRGAVVAAAFAAAASHLPAPAYCSEPTLDATFGTNGFARTNVQAGYNDTPYAFLIQPDGRIVTTGISSGAEGYFIALTRHNADGTPDPLFGGGDGKTAMHFVFRDSGHALALQSDGKIVVAGAQAENNFGSSIIPSAYRFNADGSIDSTFSTNGAQVARWDPISSGEMSAVTVMPDGKILVAGRSSANANGGQNGLGLWRLDSNGSGDASYGTNGKRVHYINSPSILLERPGVEFTPDFGALFVTTIFNNARVEFAVMQVDSDGDVVPFPSGDLLIPQIEVYNVRPIVRLQDDGKFLVGATAPAAPGFSQISAFRFLSDGSPDNSFGTNGRVDFFVGPYSNKCTDVILTDDDKILLAGDLAVSGGLFRLLSDGTPDSTFDSDGVAVMTVGENNASGWFGSLAFDGQSRLMAAGPDFTDQANFFLARFDAVPTAVRNRPPAFELVMSAYPSPTGAETRFAFDLPNESDVTLEVFDVTGRRVALLLSERRAAGHHEIRWYGEAGTGRAASGVYFGRLSARDSFNGVRYLASSRVVLLR